MTNSKIKIPVLGKKLLQIFLMLLTSFALLNCAEEQGIGNLQANISYEDGTGIKTKVILMSKNNPSLAVMSDANGNFSFVGIPSGKYTLTVIIYGEQLFYKSDLKMAGGTYEMFEIKKDTTKTLNLTVKNGFDLKVTIKNHDTSDLSADEKEFRNYALGLYKKVNNEPILLNETLAITKNGEYLFKNIPLGDYFVAMELYSKEFYYKTNTQSTDLIADATKINLIANKNLDLVLPEGTSLTVNLTDFQDTANNAEFKVILFSKNEKNNFFYERSYKKFAGIENVFIAKNSKIEFKNIQKNIYKVCFVSYKSDLFCYKDGKDYVSELEDATGIEIDDAAKTVAIKLPEGKNLTGVLKYKDDNMPVTQVHKIELFDANDQAIYFETCADCPKNQVFTYTDEQGKFEFANLLTGNYKISVDDFVTQVFYFDETSTKDNIGEASPITINPQDSTPVTKTLHINKGIKLAGTFKFNGKNLAAKDLYLVGAPIAQSAKAFGVYSQADGKFEFFDVQGDTYLYLNYAGKKYFYRQGEDATSDINKATKILATDGEQTNIEFNFNFSG